MRHSVWLPSLLLAATAFAAHPTVSRDEYAWRLLAGIDQTRQEQGLAPLAADPTLATAAQARADAMAREGWFALASPAGRRVEDDLDAARYAFRLVAEKLVRSTDDAETLVAAWRKDPAQEANSLFHPEVRRVGIGVAETKGVRIIDIVLADPAAAGDAPGTAGVTVDDPRAAVAALDGLVAQRRKAAGLADLRADPLLAEAAQQHAEALLAALERGKGPESVETISNRLTDLEQSRKPGSAALARSYDAFGRREIQAAPGSRRGNVADLVSTLVVDAPTAGVALTTLEHSEEHPGFMGPMFRKIGIGLAAGAPGPRRRIVWVLALRER